MKGGHSAGGGSGFPGAAQVHFDLCIGDDPVQIAPAKCRSDGRTHALPQAVNRTGTTPCCKARSRFPISRRSRPLFASRGRSHIASRDKKRSDRKKGLGLFPLMFLDGDDLRHPLRRDLPGGGVDAAASLPRVSTGHR